jgi:hypothetical protein
MVRCRNGMSYPPLAESPVELAAVVAIALKSGRDHPQGCQYCFWLYNLQVWLSDPPGDFESNLLSLAASLSAYTSQSDLQT